MRQRRVEALQRCAQRAEAAGLPVACTVNPFARPLWKLPKPPSPAVVLGVAAKVTGTSVAEMRSHRRSAHFSVARHFACWLLRERLQLRYVAIEHIVNKANGMGRDGIEATKRRLADDWPAVIAWRGRAAEILSRIDTEPRRRYAP